MLLSARNPSPERYLHHGWRGRAPGGLSEVDEDR
jgi:hypothetical protein